MQNEKETKKLDAEELEKRVAPAALTYDSPETAPTGGGGGVAAPPLGDPAIPEPGKSGGHRRDA